MTPNERVDLLQRIFSRRGMYWGLTAAEVDACTVTLTREGASRLGACPKGLDHWTKRHNGRPMKIGPAFWKYFARFCIPGFIGRVLVSLPPEVERLYKACHRECLPDWVRAPYSGYYKWRMETPHVRQVKWEHLRWLKAALILVCIAGVAGREKLG